MFLSFRFISAILARWFFKFRYIKFRFRLKSNRYEHSLSFSSSRQIEMWVIGNFRGALSFIMLVTAISNDSWQCWILFYSFFITSMYNTVQRVIFSVYPAYFEWWVKNKKKELGKQNFRFHFTFWVFSLKPILIHHSKFAVYIKKLPFEQCNLNVCIYVE